MAEAAQKPKVRTMFSVEFPQTPQSKCNPVLVRADEKFLTLDQDEDHIAIPNTPEAREALMNAIRCV